MCFVILLYDSLLYVISIYSAILYSPNVLIPQEEKIIVDDGGDPDTVQEK